MESVWVSQCKWLSCIPLFETPWTVVHGILQARILGTLSLLHGIFSTRGLNPGLLHCRQILYQLSHKESPRTLEWIPYPFSSRSSPPRNGTWVSCIAGRFFTNWAIQGSISESESHSVLSHSLRPHGLYSPWNSPGQNTGVGSLSLLQRIFLTQELNWGLLHCRQILYQLSYQGSPICSQLVLRKSHGACNHMNDSHPISWWP